MVVDAVMAAADDGELQLVPRTSTYPVFGIAV
jgi:hypothetical protein